jgi:hypothetical protein
VTFEREKENPNSGKYLSWVRTWGAAVPRPYTIAIGGSVGRDGGGVKQDGDVKSPLQRLLRTGLFAGVGGEG